VRSLAPVSERSLALDCADAGIVRRFLAFAQRADAEGRAEAVSALARAYLYSDLPPEARAEAELGLATVLDDPSSLVRRALAEALASAAEAPRHIVLALAADQGEVAAVVLARSPALGEAELIDCAAVGDILAQTAIARRSRLSAGLAAALAEIGQRAAVIALAGNLDADLRPGALWRAFERFGDDAELREALASRNDLPPALRNELAGATARALADFAARCDWLSAERAQRIAHEARDQATVSILSVSEDEDLAELARRMRASGALTVAVLMRALLSGDRAFFVAALSELSGLAARRAQGFIRHPDGHGFAALYAKAGLPAAFLPAFRAALAGVAALDPPRGDRLSRALCERVIAACEARAEPALAPLLSLLWRFNAEAARERARAFADDALRTRAEETLRNRADDLWRPRIEATWRAPPALAAPRRERASYVPLLIEAVAAALEDFDAPIIAPPDLAEGADAPLVELTLAELMGEDDLAPLVHLPPDRIGSLANAA
jgi:uncharacterized protein (DUF2336 family)